MSFYRKKGVKNKTLDIINVKDIILLVSENEQNAKRIRKKCLKLNSRVKIMKVPTDKTVYDCFIDNIKIAKKSRAPVLEFIFDNMVVEHAINRLPMPPKEWEILCLSGELASYTKNEHENIYWKGIEIQKSYNFVIKNTTFSTFINLAPKYKDVQELLRAVSDEVDFKYLVTQYTYSHEIDYMEILSKEFISDQIDVLSNESFKEIQKKNLPDEYLPTVSLICPISNFEKFFLTILNFYELDYPQDKIELLVIDDTESEKKLKHLLPKDESRIKFINITPKKDPKDPELFIPVPLGSKLNNGITYASNSIIFHFFDTNYYTKDSLKNAIKCLMFNKERSALMNYKSGYLHAPDNKSFRQSEKNTDLLSTLVYSKQIWTHFAFIDTKSDTNLLLNDFIKDRKSLFIKSDFINYSLNILYRDNIKENRIGEIVDKKIDVSQLEYLENIDYNVFLSEKAQDAVKIINNKIIPVLERTEF